MQLKLKSQKSLVVFQILWLAALCALLAANLQRPTILSKAAFDNVLSAVSGTLDPDVYPKADEQKIRRDLALDPALFENIVLLRNDDTLSANELVLVKSENPQALQAFADAVQTRIDNQAQIFEGYAPVQFDLMNNALVDVEGNYGLYYTGDNPQAVKDAFLSALKSGN